MKAINEIIENEMMITQEKYKTLVNKYIENNEKLSSFEVYHYQKTLSGGKCEKCGKEYKKKKIKNKMSNYIMYVPVCDCFIKFEIKKSIKDKMKTIIINANIPEEFKDATIDNLKIKNIQPETAEAISYVKKYLSKKIYDKNIGCILFGSVGTGKTHMAIAILKHIMAEKDCRGKFIHMSDIITEILSSRYDYVKELSENKVICFDDMDKLSTNNLQGQNEWKAERIFSLFNQLSSGKKIIIGTANCESVNDFGNKFDRSVVSRLAAGCKFIKVFGMDYRIIRRGKDENFRL